MDKYTISELKLPEDGIESNPLQYTLQKTEQLKSSLILAFYV